MFRFIEIDHFVKSLVETIIKCRAGVVAILPDDKEVAPLEDEGIGIDSRYRNRSVAYRKSRFW